MKINPPHFPRPLAAVLRRLPARPPTLALTQALNLLLRRPEQRERLRPLHHKRVTIHVRDMELCLHFTIDQRGFRPIAASAQPDLLIAASAYDFYLLASRQEDPDALFFNQRLLLEGDTELGLVAKNTLDGLDLTPPGWALLQQLRQRMRGYGLRGEA